MAFPTRIHSSHLRVEVSPMGAEMQSITTPDGRSWLWNGDAAWWTGRAPILFPIVGKAPDNTLTIDGKSYEMGQHGFARRSEFTLAEEGPHACRYQLTASEATRKAYPFEFLLALTYSVEGRTLTVAAEVENRDSRPMPFGFGFHPAFVWPLPGAEGKPHTITLDNGAEPTLVRLENGLLKPRALSSPFTKGRLLLNPNLFEADAMIFPEGAGTGLTYAADQWRRLKFTFENLPNLALWQKPGAPFICIEPWHGTAALVGASDDITKRPYGNVLQPGGKTRFAFTVEFPA